MFLEKGFLKQVIGRKAKLSVKKCFFVGRNLGGWGEGGGCTPHAPLGSATGNMFKMILTNQSEPYHDTYKQ